MNDQNRQLLENEITGIFENLNGLDATSDEYKNGVSAAVALIDRSITLDKLEKEEISKTEDNLVKFNEIKNNQRDRWIGYGVTSLGIIAPIILTVWGTKKTFKFEEEGTITTTVGKSFIGKLFKK